MRSDEAGGPAPGGAGGSAPSGDPRVDAVVARLDELAGLPVPAHVEVFADVHQRLQELLVSADADADGDASAAASAAGTVPSLGGMPRPGAPHRPQHGPQSMQVGPDGPAAMGNRPPGTGGPQRFESRPQRTGGSQGFPGTGGAG
ncbi:hypothetical protein [Actinomadura gamaensis]|uniref:Uncharacterized protein n=1 Tax=Actinomadura gamaensis TaxID=1763541 RepID=A0ABV9UD16_9ACTN